MARFAALAVCAAALLLAVAAGGAAAQGVGSVITRSVYASMLPNRDNSLCPARGFYTYDAFIAAANTFPGFGTTGSADDIKRDLAAFFGQTSHETTGGTRGAADQFQWGYCFKEEISKATSPPYYGRGPIQLTGRSNYDLAGRAIGKDLVSNPDLVSTDAVVSFRTAMWFWMTAQGNKPSCHNVALRRWTPTAADTAAGRVPGYGVITNIINGGLECGMGRNDANVDRIGYYTRYCGMLGTATGGNLDCYTQRNFAS
ncbi:chitinase 8-like [Triticum dicoccoides]|uniref:chitinase n=1 Tax=Triticum aestivum TaxID=4565 RepID=Q8W429_WHEAT|nr:chitinase 8-like [Triticum dicoccoides]BAB82471.1 chitinase 1 [Triticum aestivum]